MTTRELLQLLDEAQELLNQATDAENRKRLGIRQSNLEDELLRCAEAAKEGYRQAAEHLEEIGAVVAQAEARARDMRDGATGVGLRPEDDSIYQDLMDLVNGMSQAHRASVEEIRANRERLGAFNITLFGKTMTGKSTLMEILTRGNGASIGKGAQRTTREVREYEWNGMRVVDVPGVAAMDGEFDEETAYGAAHRADLIAFLITDDTPQEVEAAHLARLQQAGRPILGICNVKWKVEGEIKLRLFLRDQDRIFDPERLGALIGQFHEMTDRYGGQRVEFKSAHLQSRFLAEQPEYQAWWVEMELASRFGDIEDHICDEVSHNGRFHRQRSFLESASRASFNAWKLMMKASGTAYTRHDRIRDHGKETGTWREQFRRSCNDRIQALINRTIGRLRADIPDFADRNCENKHIGQLWRWKVEGANIDEQLQELQRALHGEAVDKIRTLGEELAKEMELLSAEFEAPELKGGRIIDHQKIWDLGTVGLAGALSLASWAVRAIPPLAPLAPFLRGASSVVTLVGQAFRGKFGDKDQRRREAIGKNTPELKRNLDQLDASVREVFARWMEESLVGLVVDHAIGQLEKAADSAHEVADFYRDQARELNQRQRRLNLEFLRTAMGRVDESVDIPDHTTVARVTGRLMVIEVRDGLEEQHIRGLQSLLREEVETLQPGLPLHGLMEWATGKPATPDAVTIDERRATARAAYDPGDPGTLARVVVARQLTGLNITSRN